jgi:glycosyltransferase involved in cell wall biosynthesis
VATAVGAIPEMVTDSINGYLVRPRSPRALAAAIASLMSSPRRRHTMGRWSHELAIREHDATFNNARIVDLMKRVAARRLQAVS